jgi:thiol:disulfide interchange protein DsbD
MRNYFIYGLLLFTSILFSQSDKVVKWSASAIKESDNTYLLTLTAKIEKPWFVYSQYISDEGPVKTSFRLENNEKLDLSEKAIEEGTRKEGFDEIFGMQLIKFSNQMIIKQRIKSKQPLDAVSGYIEFMTCNNEICYPPAEVYFRTPVN